MRTPLFKTPLPDAWTPLEPYDRFPGRVRETGVPDPTTPPETGGGKPAAEAAPAPSATQEPPAASEQAPTTPRSD